MNGEKKHKIKRRYARALNERALVIDCTSQELAEVKKGKLKIVRVKSTPQYEVYRLQR